jgi:hypothetical protein
MKILADRRKNGRIDLEAVEMLVRQSMHHAGAAAVFDITLIEPKKVKIGNLIGPDNRRFQYKHEVDIPVLDADANKEFTFYVNDAGSYVFEATEPDFITAQPKEMQRQRIALMHSDPSGKPIKLQLWPSEHPHL